MSHGPVQYFVFSFPGNQFKGEIASALAEVTSTGVIRIADIVFIKKDADGKSQVLEINELDDEIFNPFAEIVDHTEGLLSDDDILELSAEIPSNSSAALLVFEHVWATQVAEAIRNANGQVITQGFVPYEIVEAVLQSRVDV